MAKHNSSSRHDVDWKDLMKVMQAPTRNNSKCQVIVMSSNESLNNYPDNNKINYEHINRSPKNVHKEKRTDDAVCVTKLRRIFGSCCAESSLDSRVKDLEFKMKRLEKIYCKKIRKQLEELSARHAEADNKKQFGFSEADNKKQLEAANKKQLASPLNESEAGNKKQLASPSDELEYDQNKSTRPSDLSRRSIKGISIDHTASHPWDTPLRGSSQRRTRDSGSITRVVFKKDSTFGSLALGSDPLLRRKSTFLGKCASHEAFSDDSSAPYNKEDYFVLSTSPEYFDRDQIPVRDVADPSPAGNDTIGSPAMGFDEIQNKSQWVKSMPCLQRTGQDLVYQYKYLYNPKEKKSSRSLKSHCDYKVVNKHHRLTKNSFDFGVVDNSSKSMKNSYAGEEVEIQKHGSINNSFVEYTSILKHNKDINPVAANIASFNNATKGAIRHTSVLACPMEECSFHQRIENQMKEENDSMENDSSIKSLSFDRDVNVVPVKKIHRSVSACKLPIDITLSLIPKIHLLESNNGGKSGPLNLEVCDSINLNNRLGVNRAVCFDTPSSCSSSQVSVKFTRVSPKNSCFN